jgi:hypothetical protein
MQASWRPLHLQPSSNVASWRKAPSCLAARAAAFLLLTATARAEGLPNTIARLLPPGYLVLEAVQGRLTGGPHDDYLVALGRPGDDPAALIGNGTASARPLLLFRARQDGAYVLAGRNDDVVMRHDQGGQCDPFDPEGGLVMKGAYVTVQNQVACGAHWSDFITFRYDRMRGELLFDSDIYSSWKFNPSDAPDAEALVPDGHPTVRRADRRHPIGFSAWKPAL